MDFTDAEDGDSLSDMPVALLLGGRAMEIGFDEELRTGGGVGGLRCAAVLLTVVPLLMVVFRDAATSFVVVVAVVGDPGAVAISDAEANESSEEAGLRADAASSFRDGGSF